MVADAGLWWTPRHGGDPVTFQKTESPETQSCGQDGAATDFVLGLVRVRRIRVLGVRVSCVGGWTDSRPGLWSGSPALWMAAGCLSTAHLKMGTTFTNTVTKDGEMLPGVCTKMLR